MARHVPRAGIPGREGPLRHRDFRLFWLGQAVSALAMGYANLSFITWAQPRIPMEMMGRVFSVILLGSVALVPVSQLIAGALVGLSLSWTLAGAGALMTAFTLLGALSPEVRRMGTEPGRSPAAA